MNRLTKTIIVTICVVWDFQLSIQQTYNEVFCRANSGIPQDVNRYINGRGESCTSCAGNCGKLYEVTTVESFFCSCDATCRIYGDCCADFPQECPVEDLQSRDILARYGTVLQSSCHRSIAKSILISSCPHDPVACHDSSNVFGNLPVRDLDTGIDFINADCAICNGVTNGNMWPSELRCSRNANLPGNITDITAEDIILLLKNGDCFVVIFRYPESYRTCSMNSMIVTECPETCENYELARACVNSSPSLPLVTNGYDDFANIYCALCASNSEYEHLFDCGLSNFFDGGIPPGDYNFANLFRFGASNRNGIAAPGDEIECTAGQEYINEDIGCRDIILPTDQTITVLVEFKTSENLTLSEAETVNSTVDTLESDLCASSSISFQMHFVNIYNVSCNSHVTYESEFTVNMMFDFQIFWLSNEDLTISLQSNTIVNVTAEFVTNSTTLFDDLIVQGIIQELSVQGKVQPHVLHSLSCVYIRFEKNEYRLTSNDSITILASDIKIENDNFVILNTIAYVCKDALGTDTDDGKNDTEELVLLILSVIFMALSAICLIIRIILQYFITVFHKFPIKLQLSYCVALLLAILIFLFAPFARDIHWLCATFGILLHFAFLSSFVWISVIAVYMYLMFRSFEGMQKAAQNSGIKDMLPYQIAGWGIPAAIVCISVIVDFTPPEKHAVKPHYGDERCWFSPQGYSILLFFGAPVLTTVVLNIILFILVTIALRKSFEQREQMTRDGKANCSIYFKLFIIMGIGAVFLLLTPFIDHLAIWIIVIITTAGQGIYISLVSVLNKQVLKSIHKGQKSLSPSTNRAKQYTQETVLGSSEHQTPRSFLSGDISSDDGIHSERKKDYKTDNSKTFG